VTLELKGRTAVITGAAGGIGAALARAAEARGMRLALCDLDTRKLPRPKAAGLVHGADVRDAAQMRAFAKEVFATLPPVALVFVNAGVLRAGTWWRQPEEDVALMMDVNVKGAINTAQAFAPTLAAAAVPARMVFTGSVGSLLASPGLGAYSAGKHAVWALAESMHHELARENSRLGVSLLCPGAVRTGLVDAPSDSPGGGLQRRLKARMDEAGLQPDALAEIAFEGVEAERFWIFPQPDFKAAAETRFARALAEEPPTEAR
jgi:NAD(P)-dependent dehydrogenase (short-subunit alcohol dehydrogenase family)